MNEAEKQIKEELIRDWKKAEQQMETKEVKKGKEEEEAEGSSKPKKEWKGSGRHKKLGNGANEFELAKKERHFMEQELGEMLRAAGFVANIDTTEKLLLWEEEGDEGGKGSAESKSDEDEEEEEEGGEKEKEKKEEEGDEEEEKEREKEGEGQRQQKRENKKLVMGKGRIS